jgi:uncharacterized SAM-binding protein YcdF (DUF218 family)
VNSRVVAVLGYSGRRDTGLHPVCADRLAHAQRLAVERGTVILSGESDLMHSAWSGPEVVLLCDPDARSTVQNALNVAAAVRRLGAEELVAVTSSWHRARVRILLRAALRGSGVRLSVEAARGARSRLLLARELGALALLPFQLAGLMLLR